MLKTVFFGTPETAVPFLESLAGSSRVLGVVSSPDRPAGRGHALAPTAVKRAAERLRLPVHQPERLAGFSLSAALGETPDLGLVVAYGHLIPASVFNEPPLGLVNVHFSLVPRYRGAAPIQWALMRGETETGVSLFRIERGLDTGPVFLQRSVPIAPEDDAAALRAKLVAAGLPAQAELLRRLEAGPWEPTPQSGPASHAPALKREDGRIRWRDMSAREVRDLVRGTAEWPGAEATVAGQRIKVIRTGVEPGGSGVPGEITAFNRPRGFLVKCSTDSLWVERVQPEGRKEMDAPSFWNGARLSVGSRFE